MVDLQNVVIVELCDDEKRYCNILPKPCFWTLLHHSILKQLQSRLSYTPSVPTPHRKKILPIHLDFER